MTIHREIGPSYLHKPIVQGLNYYLLMVESKAKRCSPDDEDGDGEAVAAAGQHRRPPRRAAALGWR
jgi:hypothetical protein